MPVEAEAQKSKAKAGAGRHANRSRAVAARWDLIVGLPSASETRREAGAEEVVCACQSIFGPAATAAKAESVGDDRSRVERASERASFECFV